jgi:amidohydrolase
MMKGEQPLYRDSILNWVKENREEIEATWRRLHDLAEVSGQETRTTAFLADELDKLGIPRQTFDDLTGVVAVWDGQTDGPTVALRADIDALWQQVGGQWKANHSCGHDAHMTMALFAVRCLREIGFRPPGRLKVLFQPAEESGNGAQSFIQKGVVDDVDMLLGIHLRPIQEMPFGKVSPGIYHGATTHMVGRIKGVQAHAARWHLGVNVVDSLAAVIHAINAIRMDPTVPASAKVTKVVAGGGNLNIIPDEAEFGLDLRAQTNEAMDELIEKVKRSATHAGSANGAEVELETIGRMVAAVPHPAMESVVSDAIREALGPDALVPPPVTPGGEDFHFYITERLSIAATMVGLGAGLKPGLHHPEMTFDLAALGNGIAVLALSVIKLFERKEEILG